jgi:hypothetical protein
MSLSKLRLGEMCRVNIFGIEYMQLEVSMTVVITMTTGTTDGKRDRQTWNGLYHVLLSRYNIKNTYKQRKILNM